MKALTLPLILTLIFATAGCDLKFGNDLELSGDAFDSVKLVEVSTLTGVTFPTGTRGLEYLFLGSGIDQALAVKVMIPEAKISEFKTNVVITNGVDSEARNQVGRDKDWWKIDRLANRIDRKIDLPNVRFLEVTCGREDGDFVVYLSWTT